MDFGEILDKWDKLTVGKQLSPDEPLTARTPPLKAWLDRDEVYDKGAAGNLRRSRLLHKAPDAFVDLHGLNYAEAWTVLETFFENSREKGFEKVLIIHGKGNHQIQNEGVLKELSRRFIESCPFAGESGHNPAKKGGTGSTWVILKSTAKTK